MAESEPRPSEERELLAELEEQFRRLKVADVLTQTVLTVSQLGFLRMAPESRQLDEARLAIDALRALVPVLNQALPEEGARDFDSVIANLQLAYARAAAAEAGSERPRAQESATSGEDDAG